MKDNFLEEKFPNLKKSNYQITSPKSYKYNCIAWAVNDTSAWWWPDSHNQYYWPLGIKRIEILEVFIRAFEQLSYNVCDSGKFEEGFEKIAIYVKEEKPTHIARQINAKYWTSKLGQYVDIKHEIEGVSNSEYGSIAVFMKRPHSSTKLKNPS